MDRFLDQSPGTYTLVLALQAPTELQIGSLGRIQFDAPFYLYFGSALGPGGLQARVKHHLRPVRRAHWHIDYLREAAEVAGVWYSTDTARLECVWAGAALTYRDAEPVPRFGSSDCRCQSHLLAVNERPSLLAFRRRLDELGRDCGRIRRLPVDC